MSDRKLATIRRIDKLEPIPGADKILKATVGGWQLVTAKANGFAEGELIIYLEVDSWVPTEIAPFLSKGQEPREFNGVKGERLKTIKLRGTVSQGLIIPVWTGARLIAAGVNTTLGEIEGLNVTEALGIQKWERPMSAQLAGMARGNFPSFIFKTDQERIQNLSPELEQYKAGGLTFEKTEKMEGSSMTVYFREVEETRTFGVCSRNLDLKETAGNSFWSVARKLQLEEKLAMWGRNIALQGELIGPGVQNNIYGLTEHQFRLFDVFDIDTQTCFTPAARRQLAQEIGVLHSPVLSESISLTDETMASILADAEGKSQLAATEREGVVYKCNENPSISFKAISNSYLLRHGD